MHLQLPLSPGQNSPTGKLAAIPVRDGRADLKVAVPIDPPRSHPRCRSVHQDSAATAQVHPDVSVEEFGVEIRVVGTQTGQRGEALLDPAAGRYTGPADLHRILHPDVGFRSILELEGPESRTCLCHNTLQDRHHPGRSSVLDNQHLLHRVDRGRQQELCGHKARAVLSDLRTILCHNGSRKGELAAPRVAALREEMGRQSQPDILLSVLLPPEPPDTL